ncbi:MAG: glycoside hydrolase family 9 protein, partial [Bacteroidetes bacterium]|nr:glycoside hydrolase family 9 protein [Bacteroidota bacterium]
MKISFRIIWFTILATCFSPSVQVFADGTTDSWIRVNQIGYTPNGVKIAILASKHAISNDLNFEVVDAKTGKVVYQRNIGRNYGEYGPFKSSFRLNFSFFKHNGIFYLQAGTAVSPRFSISNNIFKGSADFVLRYLRQQRSGFNPFLKDSCHTKDGYIIYGPVPSSTHIDVAGGWHDATDYLQYATTSANAT